MSDPAGVHQLGEVPAARRVHGVRYLLPCGHLLGGVAGRGCRGSPDQSPTVGGALGDDQAGARALCVVRRGQVGHGCSGTVGTAARHGRHGDAVGESVVPQLDGSKAVVMSKLSLQWDECRCGRGLLRDGQEDGFAVQAAGVGVGVHGRGLRRRRRKAQAETG